MSSIIGVGIFKKENDSIYKVEKPIVMGGLDARLVIDLLEKSGLCPYYDFSYNTMGDGFHPLFYQLSEKMKHLFGNLKYEELYQDVIPMDELSHNEFPIACYDESIEGQKYYFVKESIKEINYSKFKKLSLSKQKLDDLFKGNHVYEQYDDKCIELLINMYDDICQWILNNELIYWYHIY